MKILSKVTLEHSDGRLIKPQTCKDVMVEVFQEDKNSPPMMALAIKPKELLIPIKAPCTLYGQRAEYGTIGFRLPRYRPNPSLAMEKPLQVTITSEDIPAIIRLRSLIHKALSTASGNAPGYRGAGSFTAVRRPLAPCPLNAASIASSSSLCGTSTASGRSGTFSIAGIPQAAASSADSSRDGSADEELPPLSAEQQRALNLVKGGRSIFFTGSAGTGKSLLLRHIIRTLPKDTTFVTGTTGLAGSLLGGTTINSFAGIDRGEGSEDSIIRSAMRGEAALRWKRTTHLIIDEISMMDGRLFDLLDKIARAVRGNNRPFGGIQLILSGDFHQLPPVAKGKDGAALRKFCFEATSWWECIDACVILSRVYRQEDNEFVDMLGSIRDGSCNAALLRALLSRCSRPLPLDDGILPTQLFTHKADVDAINDRQLRELPGTAVVSAAHDAGDAAALAGACPARAALALKVGAQVMLVRNIDPSKGLVNGARGVVEKFSNNGLPVVRFACCEKPIMVGRERWNVTVGGRVTATRSQVPLALAWAVTVHKSQGLTLDRVEVNLEKAFECGMAYVALSRVKSLEGLRVIGGISPAALRADPKVTAFYADIAKRAGASAVL